MHGHNLTRRIEPPLSKGLTVNDERQEWISKRAYGLWEAEGRPHGKDREHWEQAEHERAELERVALPEHLKTKRNGTDFDDATRLAVESSRGQPEGNTNEVLAAHH